jgi:hypothetical protein
MPLSLDGRWTLIVDVWKDLLVFDDLPDWSHACSVAPDGIRQKALDGVRLGICPIPRMQISTWMWGL